MVQRVLICALAALALNAGAGPVTGQTQPAAQAAIPIGASVVDTRGAPLGRIEAVLSDPAGAPSQALVRTHRVGRTPSRLKSLPISSLRPRGQDYATVLRKAEFDLLPPLEGR